MLREAKVAKRPRKTPLAYRMRGCQELPPFFSEVCPCGNLAASFSCLVRVEGEGGHFKRPRGDSCLGWEGVVVWLGCPVTWNQEVLLGPGLYYFSGNTSPVWPGYACLEIKKGVKCNKKEENIETMRSAHHKCTSSTWKCGAGSCASGFFAANFKIFQFTQQRLLMKMLMDQKNGYIGYFLL